MEMCLLYSAPHPNKSHVDCAEYFCFVVPFTVSFEYVLYFSTGIGGCGWTISARAVGTDVTFWRFFKNANNYASVSDVITFLVILYSKCNGPFSWVVYAIGVLFLDFGPRKNNHLLCCMPLVMRCKVHLNIYVGLSCFSDILSLGMDVTHCNSRTVWFISLFLWWFFSVLPPGSSLPFIFLDQWL